MRKFDSKLQFERLSIELGANEGATVGIMVGASEGSRVGALVGAELMHNPHIRGQTSSRKVLVVHRLLCCGMQLGF